MWNLQDLQDWQDRVETYRYYRTDVKCRLQRTGGKCKTYSTFAIYNRDVQDLQDWFIELRYTGLVGNAGGTRVWDIWDKWELQYMNMILKAYAKIKYSLHEIGIL